ncbi:MAG: hypothetical protein HY037_00640 [Nitrospirae bacterium]|nr:hypothetical protein [Candidatus Troglogloeales bacterium]
MSRILAIHRDCGGPATDDDTIYPGDTIPFLTEEEFALTCFTCLTEISDRSELRLTEVNQQ